MLEFFSRNSSDYAKMMLQELMKNATQRDLGNISKAKKTPNISLRRSKKAKEITLRLPWENVS